ncbi:hypothetical protein HPB50_009775 [Hyalomma asiaticum]|uniref:Uncharacterized protein n=1 Tax=Hyalomma asiaticum TaxID=266040 RepID=A0ACB7RYV5_HYAAI|nr:hypothetical protein HPB50_009775 [Hyalomma asiaticum]
MEGRWLGVVFSLCICSSTVGVVTMQGMRDALRAAEKLSLAKPGGGPRVREDESSARRTTSLQRSEEVGAGGFSADGKAVQSACLHPSRGVSCVVYSRRTAVVTDAADTNPTERTSCDAAGCAGFDAGGPSSSVSSQLETRARVPVAESGMAVRRRVSKHLRRPPLGDRHFRRRDTRCSIEEAPSEEPRTESGTSPDGSGPRHSHMLEQQHASSGSTIAGTGRRTHAQIHATRATDETQKAASEGRRRQRPLGGFMLPHSVERRGVSGRSWRREACMERADYAQFSLRCCLSARQGKTMPAQY